MPFHGSHDLVPPAYVIYASITEHKFESASVLVIKDTIKNKADWVARSLQTGMKQLHNYVN